ncbi:MAG: helix-turn-helix domain-containing protein [Caldilineaceae bacterium]|nr:helix-turn-helix domain-containing protein [Caldilineaceae bacterium]
MSVKIMARVWDDSMHTGSALLMLLAIADHANDEGVCWPSVETLAAKARVQARQAQNLIAHLVESGELAVQRGAGRRNTSIYVVTIGGKGATQRAIDYAEKVQSSAEKVQSSAEKVQSSALKGAIAIAPDPLEPSIEPSLEPLERAAALPPAPPVAPPPPVVLAEPQTATAPEPTVAAALDGEPLPAAPAPATTKNLAQQPVVLAYRDVFLAYPSKAQMAQLLGHGVTDMQRWTDVLAAWCKAGYSPRNLAGMLDWYDDPQRMAASRPQPRASTAATGGKGAPRTKVEASMQAVDNVMAMIERGEL